MCTNPKNLIYRRNSKNRHYEEIKINFTINRKELLKQIEDKHLEKLKIYDTKSESDALEFLQLLFSLAAFEEKSFIIISFKIDEKFEENFNETPKLGKENSFLITLETIADNKHEIKSFWTLAGYEDIFSLNISDDKNGLVSDFFQTFLVGEIRDEQTGILINYKDFPKNKKIELRQIGKSDGSNLLKVAIESCHYNIIERLIQYGLDVDYTYTNDCHAIDYAWEEYEVIDDKRIKEKYLDIVLMLLNANSKLPNLDLSKAPEKVKEFIDMSEGLHDLIDNKNEKIDQKLAEIRRIRLSKPNLCYFYDRNNRSLLMHAYESGNIKIIKLLVSLDIFMAYDEAFIELIESDKSKAFVNDKNIKAIRKIHRDYAKDLPSLHLLILKSKSKIANNQRNISTCYNLIEKAFEKIDQYETCSIVLKTAATWKKIKIFFDFKYDYVYYLDPTSKDRALGNTFTNGIINIGAKSLSDEKGMFAVLGVMIHELCHLAVLITYMNNFDPYPMGISEIKIRYEDEVMVECEQNKDKEEIVELVFSAYIKEHIPCELIVRAPQMIMHYCDEKSKIAGILEQRRNEFNSLFKYFEEVIEKMLKEAFPILIRLQNEVSDIPFKQLTSAMQMKILHAKIKFQGAETSFSDLIDDDVEILQELYPEDIQKILIDGQKIEISEEYTANFTHEIIERKFIKFETDTIDVWNELKDTSSEVRQNIKMFEQIESEAKSSKLFLLSDIAGAGKTTIFEDYSKKLKENNKKSWVFYIKLREYKEIFRKYEKAYGKLKIEEIFELLLEIHETKFKMEARNEKERKSLTKKRALQKKILNKLFKKGNAIFLFDGLDEISPKFNNFLIDFLKVMRDKTRNQIWVSTRQQQAALLKEAFHKNVYKFIPYSKSEKEKLIKNILINSDFDDELDTALKELCNFFTSIERRYDGHYYVSNLLMIESITKLYAEKMIDLSPNSRLSFYGVYDKIFEKQMANVDRKIETEDRNAFLKFTLGDVHQVFALKFIFEDYERKYDVSLDCLALIKAWEKIKRKWTEERIQRYGFLTVNFEDLDCKYSIEFAHKTYAEFFVTNYILSFVFCINDSICSKEFENVFKLILIIGTEINNFKVIQEFLLDYMKHESKKDNQIFSEKMEDAITKNISKIHRTILKFTGKECQSLPICLEFWTNFLKNEKPLCVSFWIMDIKKEDDEEHEVCEVHEDLLRKILLRNRIENYKIIAKILQIAEDSLGENWHKVFNKSKQALISNENIVKIDVKDEETRRYNINLLKYLDLVHKNYEMEEIEFIYDSYVTEPKIKHLLTSEVRSKILSDARVIFKGNDDQLNEIEYAFAEVDAKIKNSKPFLT